MKYVDALLVLLWCLAAILMIYTNSHGSISGVVGMVCTGFCGLQIVCKYILPYKENVK